MCKLRHYVLRQVNELITRYGIRNEETKSTGNKPKNESSLSLGCLFLTFKESIKREISYRGRRERKQSILPYGYKKQFDSREKGRFLC